MPATVSLSDFAARISPGDGCLPDGVVVGSARAEWPVVFDLARRNGWPTKDLTGTIGVWPAPGVQVNLFPNFDEVTFDFDVREVTTQAALDALCAFLRGVGRALGKCVAVSYEGVADRVFLRYDPAADAFAWT